MAVRASRPGLSFAPEAVSHAETSPAVAPYVAVLNFIVLRGDRVSHGTNDVLRQGSEPNAATSQALPEREKGQNIASLTPCILPQNMAPGCLNLRGPQKSNKKPGSFSEPCPSP